MIELYITGMFFSLLLGLAVLFFRTSWTQVIIYPLLIVLAYISLAEMPGVGKPMSWEWRQFEKAEVLHYSIIEDEVIYLLLRIEGEIKPRYYSLSWDEAQARNLTNSSRFARNKIEAGEGYTLMLSNGNFDNTPKFYAAPQQPPPVKKSLEVLIERD
jgi:hypothetical protein